MWVRLVWWPMGKGLGTGNVGKVSMVAHEEWVFLLFFHFIYTELVSGHNS